METKESKEKNLKELTDKDLKNVSGGGNKGSGMTCLRGYYTGSDYGKTFRNRRKDSKRWCEV